MVSFCRPPCLAIQLHRAIRPTPYSPLLQGTQCPVQPMPCSLLLQGTQHPVQPVLCSPLLQVTQCPILLVSLSMLLQGIQHPVQPKPCSPLLQETQRIKLRLSCIQMLKRRDKQMDRQYLRRRMGKMLQLQRGRMIRSRGEGDGEQCRGGHCRRGVLQCCLWRL